jgi:hypothetical protein
MMHKCCTIFSYFAISLLQRPWGSTTLRRNHQFTHLKNVHAAESRDAITRGVAIPMEKLSAVVVFGFVCTGFRQLFLSFRQPPC